MDFATAANCTCSTLEPLLDVLPWWGGSQGSVAARSEDDGARVRGLNGNFRIRATAQLRLSEALRHKLQRVNDLAIELRVCLAEKNLQKLRAAQSAFSPRGSEALPIKPPMRRLVVQPRIPAQITRLVRGVHHRRHENHNEPERDESDAGPGRHSPKHAADCSDPKPSGKRE